MNRQQSTSISGKHHPENARGEGEIPQEISQITRADFAAFIRGQHDDTGRTIRGTAGLKAQ
jgi:hypothetical protein